MGGLLLRNQTFDFSSTDSTHKAYYPSYDLDGNATSYPVPANPGANATLVWDAENRLTSATVAGVTTTYRYDYLSRRIAKITNNPITNNPVTVSFLYDGWNLIAEYTGTVLEKTYTWGMDILGSMQGAGGVGGLLSVHDQVDTYYPTYDGNGNVSEYLDATGAVQAHYEYDPFGNTTVSTGAKKADFFHRFSTKPQDAETGLYYYGYRYYDPVTGRWPSRDPIEEEGGYNLYGMVGNDSISSIDFIGLDKIKCDVDVNLPIDKPRTIKADYNKEKIEFRFSFSEDDPFNDDDGHGCVTVSFKVEIVGANLVGKGKLLNGHQSGETKVTICADCNDKGKCVLKKGDGVADNESFEERIQKNKGRYLNSGVGALSRKETIMGTWHMHLKYPSVATASLKAIPHVVSANSKSIHSINVNEDGDGFQTSIGGSVGKVKRAGPYLVKFKAVKRK